MDDSTSLDDSTAASIKNEILWKYYTDRVPMVEALCKTCDRIVLCRGGSTVSLSNHLKYAHNIAIDDIYKELKEEIKEEDFLTDTAQPLDSSSEHVINTTLLQEKPQVAGSEMKDTNGEGTTNEWLSCSMCEYSTSSKGHLKQHVKVVHDFVKDFSCSLCYFHTSKGYDLDIHMERTHNNAMVSKKRQKPEPDELTNVPKVTITHSAAPRNDKLASELDQCIEQELSVRPKRRKPFVPPTDGWKRFMDSDPPKTAEDESSEKGKKKESDGWKRFM